MEVDFKREPQSPVKKSPSPVKSVKEEAMSDDDVPLVRFMYNSPLLLFF